MKIFEFKILQLCTLILCMTLFACGGDSDSINNESPIADNSCVQTGSTDCVPVNDPESGTPTPTPTPDDPAEPAIPPVDTDNDGPPEIPGNCSDTSNPDADDSAACDPPSDPPTDPGTPVSKCPNDPTNVDALFCHFNQHTNS